MTAPESQIGFEQLGLANVLKQNTLAVPPTNVSILGLIGKSRNSYRTSLGQ